MRIIKHNSSSNIIHYWYRVYAVSRSSAMSASVSAPAAPAILRPRCRWRIPPAWPPAAAWTVQRTRPRSPLPSESWFRRSPSLARSPSRPKRPCYNPWSWKNTDRQSSPRYPGGCPIVHATAHPAASWCCPWCPLSCVPPRFVFIRMNVNAHTSWSRWMTKIRNPF